jgi:spermidine synthase/S-adenosylmethionine decarboxylase proenzyme
MKPTGIQFIAEFIYCSKKNLNNKKTLKQILKNGIQKCGLTLKRLSSHQFDPVGVTVTAIISESHIAIHTYPEAHHASIDIFTCSADSQAPLKLLNFLKKQLKPKTVRVGEIIRGNPLEIQQVNWITTSSSYGFGIKYHIKQNFLSKKTKYQQIDIIENENFGKMLFLDKELQTAEKDVHIYNSNMIAPLIKRRKLGKIAILGGGDGGLLYEILKHNPKKVTLIDIDKEVISASKKFLKSICKDAFNKPNVKIIINNSQNFLEKTHSFDAVIYDLTMHPESFTHAHRTVFLNKLFLKIKNSLNKNAVISLQCCSEYDKETIKILKRILPKYFKNLNFTKTFIPSFCGNWIFASGEKK